MVSKEAEEGHLGWTMPHRVLYRPVEERAGPGWRGNKAEEGGSLARRLFLEKDLDHRNLNKNPGSRRLGLAGRRQRGYGTGADFYFSFVFVWY